MADRIEQTARAAFQGDPVAAAQLAEFLCPDVDDSVRMALAMWSRKVARPAFASFLKVAWSFEHRAMLQALGTRKARCMWRYAQPELALPSSGAVRIFRGTRGVSVAAAARGLSWTLDRSVARFFAQQAISTGAPFEGKPLVIAAEVPSNALAYLGGEESEAIATRYVRSARAES